MKSCHLLGNGPSRSSFAHEPKGDVFGCNFSDETLSLKATFITDATVFEHLTRTKQKLPWPIICPDRFRKDCQRLVLPVHDTFDRICKLGESTGHHAAIWLQDNGYREIHLWGFDSLKTATAWSDTNDKIPKAIWSDGNVPRWRKFWQEIFERKKATFIVH